MLEIHGKEPYILAIAYNGIPFMLHKTLIASLIFAASTSLTYAQTPFPQHAELQYVGPYGVPATMTFDRTGNRYKVVAQINAPLYQMRFSSQGSIQGNTLKPDSYQDQRRGKSYAGARFNYGNRTITYGKTDNTQTVPMQGNTFDLFTLAWQLALNNGELPSNLRITNGKSLSPVQGMRHLSAASYNINGGSTPVSRYQVRKGDSTIEYAFATDFANIPAQIIYTDDGKTYRLKLRSAKLDGVTVEPK